MPVFVLINQSWSKRRRALKRLIYGEQQTYIVVTGEILHASRNTIPIIKLNTAQIHQGPSINNERRAVPDLSREYFWGQEKWQVAKVNCLGVSNIGSKEGT